MEKELWKDFLNTTVTQRELLDAYLELRLHFQEIGFSESDLVNPPRYTKKMMELRDKFISQKNYLLNQLNNYGFNVSEEDFINHINPLLQKINELTPLKNGNS